MKRLPAAFYALQSGREPVRDWLKELDPEDRKIVGEDIKDVEYGWPSCRSYEGCSSEAWLRNWVCEAPTLKPQAPDERS